MRYVEGYSECVYLNIHYLMQTNSDETPMRCDPCAPTRWGSAVFVFSFSTFSNVQIKKSLIVYLQPILIVTYVTESFITMQLCLCYNECNK